jgi:hypothetical protein
LAVWEVENADPRAAVVGTAVGIGVRVGSTPLSCQRELSE